MPDFSKELRKHGARIEARQDQRLAELRSVYRSLDIDERKKLTAWAKSVAALKSPDIYLPTTAQVEVLVQNDEKVDAIRVSADSLLRAIEAWDKGKRYLPRALRDS
jgi:hypothetical protein